MALIGKEIERFITRMNLSEAAAKRAAERQARREEADRAFRARFRAGLYRPRMWL